MWSDLWSILRAAPFCFAHRKLRAARVPSSGARVRPLPLAAAAPSKSPSSGFPPCSFHLVRPVFLTPATPPWWARRGGIKKGVMVLHHSQLISGVLSSSSNEPPAWGDLARSLQIMPTVPSDSQRSRNTWHWPFRSIWRLWAQEGISGNKLSPGKEDRLHPTHLARSWGKDGGGILPGTLGSPWLDHPSPACPRLLLGAGPQDYSRKQVENVIPLVPYWLLSLEGEVLK